MFEEGSLIAGVDAGKLAEELAAELHGHGAGGAGAVVLVKQVLAAVEEE